MLGPPIDAWYVWLGVSIAALAVLGVATSAAPSPPSNAEGVAQVVDTVDASRPPATGRHPTHADRIRVDGHRIALVDDGTALVGAASESEATAIVRGGPVTPARRGTPLREVALGRPPSAAFEAPEQFREAASAARAEPRTIEPAGDEVVVRSVRWEEVDVTILAA